ncbi:hypothetical protein GPM19_11855 [Halomonas sp. ZH2S]|uniref:Uncharacterized protein n=1 Tax=Vreelandella zhuhanensis TaxID=2684210 RepID=A0A7X3H1Z6_9GAMM|nr:hypothetical protein [Halomonas zhuhanensis]MWJ28879.1 hypothetical protein [Halomonas zhuhanensis]
MQRFQLQMSRISFCRHRQAMAAHQKRIASQRIANQREFHRGTQDTT